MWVLKFTLRYFYFSLSVISLTWWKYNFHVNIYHSIDSFSTKKKKKTVGLKKEINLM